MPVALFVSKAKKTTLLLSQEHSEERNTINMTTGTQTENCSLQSPSHWKNAENDEMSGSQKSKDNRRGFRPLLFP